MGTNLSTRDNWSSGEAYERYVGRWSRLVAQEFIPWLTIAENKNWLDVGCGTGILSQTILAVKNPASIQGVDRSENFIHTARTRLNDSRVQFQTGDAQSLPVETAQYDVAVSGLVLNFVPDKSKMIDEMRRAVRPGGVVALYVWDYASRMQFMRHFWNAAGALDPVALDMDEGKLSPICDPDALRDLFESTGLFNVETRPIDISTTFKDFDDFWDPFLGGNGPAPSYVMSLSEARRANLRERLHDSLPFAIDGSIPLVARAWAVKGVK